jgi:hypothetical protein
MLSKLIQIARDRKAVSQAWSVTTKAVSVFSGTLKWLSPESGVCLELRQAGYRGMGKGGIKKKKVDV